MMEVVSGDIWSYKTYKAAVKSSPPTNQHVTGQTPFLLPTTDLLTPTSPGGLPTLSLTTQGSWLP